MSVAWLRRWYLVLLMGLLLPVLIPQARLSARAANWSDAEGYYLYLPGIFSWSSIHQIRPESVGTARTLRGERIIKYTCGVAIFEAPLFLLTQAVASARGIDRLDVFHPYYGRSIYVTAFLVAGLGLWLLQQALRARGFAEPAVGFTLLGTLLGTNLFHYVVREPGMSHVYSFTLLAAVVGLTPRFYARPTIGYAAMLGACWGWLVLIRPSVVLALPFTLLADCYTWPELRARAHWWRQQWRTIIVMAVAGLLLLSPQLLYWHTMTGHWIQYSYGTERFSYWASPKILAVLFDTQNGLFLYSPLVLLSVAGLAWGWRDRRVQAPAVLFIFGAITYTFASWWAWWFGGAFGHRCYVEYYALLALPLAFCFERIWAFSAAKMTLALVGVALLLFYAVRMDFLYKSSSEPWDGPSWRWSWTKITGVWRDLL